MKYYHHFAKYLTKIKHRKDSEYMALCPFHPDKNPSFSFNAETGVWHCFGCEEKGNIKDFLERFGEEVKMEKKKLTNKINYEYRDLDNNLIYVKTRYEYNDGTKSFKIDWKGKDKKLLLYNLPSLKLTKPNVIYFAEGEKSVHALIEALPDSVDDVTVLGYSQSPEKEFDNSFDQKQARKYLKGKTIYIFVDNDEIGEKKAKAIFKKVKRYAQKIFVIRFFEKPRGYDIADFLSEGHHLDEALLLGELEYEANYEDIDIFKLLAEGVPPREFIDDEFKLPKGVLSLIAGLGSVGKGYFLLYLSLKWILKGLNVCYITAEDDKDELKRRLLTLIPKVVEKGQEQEGDLRIHDFFEDEVIPVIEDAVEDGFDVIIIDPIGFLVEDENMNSQIGKIMRKLQIITRKHKVNVILSHHLRKYAMKDIKDKYDMLDAIRGAGSFHNNARYVWFARRSKEDDSVVEVYNAKNSYAPSNNDYAFKGLFPSDEELIIEKIGNKPEEEKSEKGGVML